MRYLFLAPLLALAGCAPPSADRNAAMANDTRDAEAIEQDAAARAERLDEQAGALDADAARLGGNAAAALRHDAADDRADAAAVLDDGGNRVGIVDAAALNAADAAPR